MNETDLILMEPGYRQHLKNKYYTPLILRLLFCGLFLITVHLLILGNGLEHADPNITIIKARFHKVSISKGAFISTILCSFLTLGYTTIKMLTAIGRHYYQDYRFGYVIREHTCISRIMPTPAGINIYWLNSDAIFTFMPDPYVVLTEGAPVIISYLKYTKELLKYELPDRQSVC